MKEDLQHRDLVPLINPLAEAVYGMTDPYIRDYEADLQDLQDEVNERPGRGRLGEMSVTSRELLSINLRKKPSLTPRQVDEWAPPEEQEQQSRVLADQKLADAAFLGTLATPAPPSPDARSLLAAQVAAENEAFLGSLQYYRAARTRLTPADAAQPREEPRLRVTPYSAADADAANAAFQKHLVNYDPAMARRINAPSRRRRGWGGPPVSRSDAAAADAAFFRSLRHWGPG